MSVVVPAPLAHQVLSATVGMPDSPFQRLVGLPRLMLADTRHVPAAERRPLTEHFLTSFEWQAIRPWLPLRLVMPSETPEWQLRRCRSHYRWLPAADLQSAQDLAGLDDFDLVLRLFRLRRQRLASDLGATLAQPVGAAAL